jgi:signal transduction histidine kinase
MDFILDEKERQRFLDEVERMIRDSVSAVSLQLDKRIDDLRSSTKLIGDQLLQFSVQSKRTEETANQAKKIADEVQHEARTMHNAITSHTRILESRITQIAEENRVQTDTLTELVSSQEARTAKAQETQDLVKLLGGKVDQLITADSERKTREAVSEAIKVEEGKRVETFWKRLPVWIALILFLSGVLIWLFNTLVMQNRIMNNLPIKGDKLETKSTESK